MKMDTGSKGIPGRKSLFRATGSTQAILYEKWKARTEPSPEGADVPPETIEIGDLGRLDTNGVLYVALPDGAPRDATPLVADFNNYTFDVNAAKLKQTLDAVTFTATNWFLPVLIDTNGVSYPTPHWKTNQSHPAMFVSGSRMRTTTGFNVLQEGAFPAAIVVKGEASNGHVFWGTNSAGSTDFETVADLVLENHRVDFFNPLTIHWSYAVPGRTEFVDAGTSSNQVYVTWSASATANLYHTVLDVACRNAIGRTIETDIVAGIWSGFEGRNVNRWDGVGPMRYWGPISYANGLDTTKCIDTFDLVKYADGKCGAWGEFFRDTLSTHGVANTKHVINSPQNFQGFSIYAILPGQGGTPLARLFSNHEVVSHGVNLYDPSYGAKHLSKLLWEDGCVDYYVGPETPDEKGVLQTSFTPDFP